MSDSHEYPIDRESIRIGASIIAGVAFVLLLIFAIVDLAGGGGDRQVPNVIQVVASSVGIIASVVSVTQIVRRRRR